MRLKAEAKDQACLKAEEEARFSEELRLQAGKEEQACLKEDEETRLAEELSLNAKSVGLFAAGVESF